MSDRVLSNYTTGGNAVARRTGGTVGKTKNPWYGNKSNTIKGSIVRDELPRKTPKAIGPGKASKAGKLAKAGRLVKGAGPVGLAAAATYELAKIGVDNRNEKLKQGYIQVPIKNAPGQWTPSGAHPGYQKAAKRRAQNASKMSERNYSTYGNQKNNAPRLSDAKKQWKRNIAKVNKEGGGGAHRAEALTKANQDALYNYRLNRRLRGDFKGKYYGPDEFKGSEKKLAAWRAAGSPKDKSRFA